MRVLIPELVYSRQMFAGSVPDIAGVSDMFVSHLHLGIPEPEGHLLEVYFHGSFKDAAGTRVFADVRLPLCVLYPIAHVMTLHSEFFFEVSPVAILIVFELKDCRGNLSGQCNCSDLLWNIDLSRGGTNEYV